MCSLLFGLRHGGSFHCVPRQTACCHATSYMFELEVTAAELSSRPVRNTLIMRIMTKDTVSEVIHFTDDMRYHPSNNPVRLHNYFVRPQIIDQVGKIIINSGISTCCFSRVGLKEMAPIQNAWTGKIQQMLTGEDGWTENHAVESAACHFASMLFFSYSISGSLRLDINITVCKAHASMSADLFLW